MMATGHVDRVCYFREGAARTATFAEMLTEFQREFDGVNEYVQFDEDLVQRATEATASGPHLSDPVMLNTFAAALFQNAVDRLHENSPHAQKKTIILGLEPYHGHAAGIRDPVATLTSVSNNTSTIARLAQEIAFFQGLAPAGRELPVVVRFASEMNEQSAPYGRPSTPAGAQAQGHAYRQAFQDVKRVFQAHAPHVQLSFSPALNSGTDVHAVLEYWPGPGVVDVVGGTWYTRDLGQGKETKVAFRVFHDYFTALKDKPAVFGIDEMGGGKGTGQILTDSDAILTMMWNELKTAPVNFAYVSLFVNKTTETGHIWGNDVHLKFLPL